MMKVWHLHRQDSMLVESERTDRNVVSIVILKKKTEKSFQVKDFAIYESEVTWQVITPAWSQLTSKLSNKIFMHESLSKKDFLTWTVNLCILAEQNGSNTQIKNKEWIFRRVTIVADGPGVCWPTTQQKSRELKEMFTILSLPGSVLDTNYFKFSGKKSHKQNLYAMLRIGPGLFRCHQGIQTKIKRYPPPPTQSKRNGSRRFG